MFYPFKSKANLFLTRLRRASTRAPPKTSFNLFSLDYAEPQFLYPLKLDLTLILAYTSFIRFSRFVLALSSLDLWFGLYLYRVVENCVLCPSSLLFPHFIDMLIYTEQYSINLRTFRSRIIAQDVYEWYRLVYLCMLMKEPIMSCCWGPWTMTLQGDLLAPNSLWSFDTPRLFDWHPVTWTFVDTLVHPRYWDYGGFYCLTSYWRLRATFRIWCLILLCPIVPITVDAL